MMSPSPLSREVHIKTVQSTATRVGRVFEQEEEWTHPFFLDYFTKPVMINTSVLISRMDFAGQNKFQCENVLAVFARFTSTLNIKLLPIIAVGLGFMNIFSSFSTRPTGFLLMSLSRFPATDQKLLQTFAATEAVTGSTFWSPHCMSCCGH